MLFLSPALADINRQLLNSAKESCEGDIEAENQNQEEEGDDDQDGEGHADMVDKVLADEVAEIAGKKGILCVIAD
jgi:hypothetical protein